MRQVSEALPTAARSRPETSQSRAFVRSPDSVGAGGLRSPSRRRRSSPHGVRRARGGTPPPQDAPPGALGLDLKRVSLEGPPRELLDLGRERSIAKLQGYRPGEG